MERRLGFISLLLVQIEKLAASNIGDFIKPSMPSFVDVTKMLSKIMIDDVNNTAAINRWDAVLLFCYYY